MPVIWIISQQNKEEKVRIYNKPRHFTEISLNIKNFASVVVMGFTTI